jgi:DNA-directed RNA polymerase specialized sigma24 family protein
VTSPAPTGTAEQKAAMRAAERRRQAADLLRVTASICAYTTVQIGNGLNPEEARQAVMETAGELAAVVVALRRLARLPARERAAVARLMAGRGMGTQEIANRLGVSAHTAWNYQRGLRGDGQPWAPG